MFGHPSKIYEPGGTQFIIIYGKNVNLKSKVKDANCCIMVNQVRVTRSSVVKYLGIDIDEQMSWTDHVKNLATKIRSYCPVFYNMRKVLKRDVMIIVYKAVVDCHVAYCNVVWASTYRSTVDMVKRACNNVFRIIVFKKRSETVRNDMKIAGVIDVYGKNVVGNIVAMKKICEGSYKANICAVKWSSKDHEIKTRRDVLDFMQIDSYKTNILKFSIKIRSAILWNKLLRDHPNYNFKKTDTIKQLKCKLKRLLLENNICASREFSC